MNGACCSLPQPFSAATVWPTLVLRSAAFDFYPNTPHVETLLVFEKT